jgi:hypothetical protein
VWSATGAFGLRVTTALAKHAAGQVTYRISCPLYVSHWGANFKEPVVVCVQWGVPAGGRPGRHRHPDLSRRGAANLAGDCRHHRWRGVPRDQPPRPDRHQPVRRAIAPIVKRRAAAAGIDPTGYSAHSLRAGCATKASGRWPGVPPPSPPHRRAKLPLPRLCVG